MNSTALALFGAALAVCGSTAAQATNFDFSIVYWEGTDSPPSDPAATQTAHFIIDDTTVSTTSDAARFFDVSGQFFGFNGNAIVDLYPDWAFGGLTIIPTPDTGPDYSHMSELAGDAVFSGDVSAPHILTGIYDMTDYEHVLPGTWRVTITEASPAPEPASWAMMVGGFGLVGGALRGRTKATVRLA
jgi:hypothetical protein